MIVRHETRLDREAIRDVNILAFQGHPYSQQTEHLIVEELRSAGALALSLVAEVDGNAVGHVAFSAARIGDSAEGWFLLGPLAVVPDCQGRGIGSSLVIAGLEELRAWGADGCVLVGDPAFYSRFGFSQYSGVTCHGVPDENVLCLPMSRLAPAGEVLHHPAFLAGT